MNLARASLLAGLDASNAIDTMLAAAHAAAADCRADGYSLRYLGDEALRVACRDVTVDNVAQLAVLLPALRQICTEHKGAGLSANQVGGTLRVFVARIDGKLEAFVNPVLFGDRGPLAVFTGEGCLSIPGFTTSTRRHVHINLRWTTGSDPLGRMQGRTFVGPEAQCIQHELEHLDGKLLVDGVLRNQKRHALRLVAEHLSAKDRR